MNQTIKQKWITALRSGKFTQITGTMRVSKYECCVLGVLCTVAGAKWKKHQNKMTDKTKHYYLVGVNGQPTTRSVLMSFTRKPSATEIIKPNSQNIVLFET